MHSSINRTLNARSRILERFDKRSDFVDHSFRLGRQEPSVWWMSEMADPVISPRLLADFAGSDFKSKHGVNPDVHGTSTARQSGRSSHSEN
jgi:hypothetical protein